MTISINEALRFFAIVVFVRMALGAARAFTPTGRRSLLSALIAVSFWATMAVTAVTPPGRGWMMVSGVVGLVASLALFQWAQSSIRGKLFSWIFCDDQPQFLHTAGPYAYVRNPFYASYLLAIAATVLRWPSALGAAIVAAMFVYFTAAAMFEERKFRSSPLRADYDAYSRNTGRLLPRLWAPRRAA
jgi:protein-S-isoprenylcysteine O-methyltransferase Ste14